MSEWVTQREAARLLGVHASAVPKMVRRGDLTPRPARPSLSRTDVLALREARDWKAAQAAEPRPPRPQPRPPDQEHEWLTPAQAGEVMDVGAAAVSVRARRGRLPSELHDGRRWFRRDLLELVKHADAVKRGGTIA